MELHAMGLTNIGVRQDNIFLNSKQMQFWFPAAAAAAAAAAKSLQSCPTLCDPIDGSPPGSPSLGFSRQEYCWAPNYHNETTAIYKAASEPGTVQAHWLTKTSNNHSRENYY